jgi:hypothetical protein
VKSPIQCSNPKCDEQVGWHHTYLCTDRGCDPPEDVYYNEDYVDSDGAVYCSRECMEEVGAHEEAECPVCGCSWDISDHCPECGIRRDGE